MSVDHVRAQKKARHQRFLELLRKHNGDKAAARAEFYGTSNDLSNDVVVRVVAYKKPKPSRDPSPTRRSCCRRTRASRTRSYR